MGNDSEPPKPKLETTRLRRDFYFLSPEAVEALPNYQYQGDDLSILYKYVTSPLANFCVNQLTPRTVAPNAITLSGLSFMVASYGFMWYYVPTLEPQDAENAPRWIFLFHFCAMLCYQTLDNMDGKQARRTGSSSPLGLLFDHACDAINSIFGSINWIVAMGLNPREDPLWCWFIIFGPFSLMFVSTWEEYYSGKLVLPIFNGPNEGLLGGALLSLTTYFYGPGFWQGTFIFDDFICPLLQVLLGDVKWVDVSSPRNADIQVMLSAFLIFREILSKILGTIQIYGIDALYTVSPFLCLSFTTLCIGYIDVSIFSDIPRASAHLFSFIFCDMVTDLMLAHVSNQKYIFRRRALVPLIGVLLIAATSRNLLPDTNSFFIVYATAGWTFLATKAVLTVDDICTVLDIWCFDIVNKRSAEDSNNGISASHPRHDKKE